MKNAIIVRNATTVGAIALGGEKPKNGIETSPKIIMTKKPKKK